MSTSTRPHATRTHPTQAQTPPAAWLAGGVLEPRAIDDDLAELRALVADLAERHPDSAEPLGPHDTAPLNRPLWDALTDAGLVELIGTPDLGAGPGEVAVVLYGLARHRVSAPVAEHDLLSSWLADAAGITRPDGITTVAVTSVDIESETVGRTHSGRLSGVPWAGHADHVLVAIRRPQATAVGLLDAPVITPGRNLGGESRSRLEFTISDDELTTLSPSIGDEILYRGAWARCIQTLGALDSAATLTVAHTRDRQQFGHPLSAFQAVAQSLAQMAAEIERARAATTLAVAAAVEFGFGATRTHHAITLAKVVIGQVVGPVCATAHQLHGAIGVTSEYPLARTTLRARGWVDDYGGTTAYARSLGRFTLGTDGLSDLIDSYLLAE